MTADNGLVLLPSEHRLDEAELPEASFEGVELLVGDPPWVGRVRAELVDRDLVDREEGRGNHADLTLAAATHSSRPSIGMR